MGVGEIIYRLRSICGAMMGMDDLRHMAAQLRSTWRVCICLEQVGSIYKAALSRG